MSCEELAMFCSILAYTPHIRQNHSTLTYFNKKKYKKVISSEVQGGYH